MSNKEFNKRFEEILKDLDGLFTSILYVFDPNNPESDFKKSNEYPHQKVVNALQKELDEAYSAINTLRSELNEVNRGLLKNILPVVSVARRIQSTNPKSERFIF